MCISAKASVISFLINLVSCVGLIKLGNDNLKFYNYIFAGFLLFVSLMQIVDFGAWIDLNCTKGYNKIASFFGPILIYLQPLFIVFAYLYLVKNTKVGKNFYNKNIKIKENTWFDHFNLNNKEFNFIKLVNIVYVVVLLIAWYQYFWKGFTTNPEYLCTGTSKSGNLKWNWFYEKNNIIRSFITLFNIVILNILVINPWSLYLKIGLIVFYGMLFLTKMIKQYSKLEVWCYVINFSALVLLLIQKLFPQIN